MVKFQLFRIFKYIALLLISCFIGCGLWVWFYAHTPFQPDSMEKKIIEVSLGNSRNIISEKLTEAGIIREPQKFILLGVLLQKWTQVKAGEYELSASDSPIKLFKTLTSGISVSYLINFPEGSNVYQMADILELKFPGKKAEFIKYAFDPKFTASLGLNTGLEGYLHPASYSLNKNMSSQEILTLLFKKQNSLWTDAWALRAKELGFTKHQILTLASVIEKETGAPFERKMISGVFHNRLKIKMRLQSDPTTIYGMWKRYTGNIRRSDLLEKTPYNTYAMDGLPVGPIANPGKEAIEAALYPDETPYLYFVSKNDGTHFFSKTLKEHTNAVKKTQLDPSAREGRSWRDLHKNQKN